MVTLLGKLHKFRALPRDERRLLVVAAGALPIIAVGVRVMRLERVLSWLVRLAGRRDLVTDRAHTGVRAKRIRKVAGWATDHGLYRGNCLSQSLTLWWLLRRQGIESELRIGVRKHAGGLEAHAWVECLGEVLNDRADVRERLVPFDGAIVPRSLRFD